MQDGRVDDRPHGGGVDERTAEAPEVRRHALPLLHHRASEAVEGQRATSRAHDVRVPQALDGQVDTG